jgi:hypothetical protein
VEFGKVVLREDNQTPRMIAALLRVGSNSISMRDPRLNFLRAPGLA